MTYGWNLWFLQHPYVSMFDLIQNLLYSQMTTLSNISNYFQVCFCCNTTQNSIEKPISFFMKKSTNWITNYSPASPLLAQKLHIFWEPILPNTYFLRSRQEQVGKSTIRKSGVSDIAKNYLEQNHNRNLHFMKCQSTWGGLWVTKSDFLRQRNWKIDKTIAMCQSRTSSWSQNPLL